MKIKFVKSATEERGYPQSKRPEVAIVGRSNAGKSSFINALASTRQPVAKVSSTPGKTTLLNFFNVEEHYTLVDMPGYGFAARSGDQRRDWRPMVEEYLLKRENLVGLLLIMDIRRDWSQDEQSMLDWVAQRELPLMVILNKMDKEKKNAQVKRAREVAAMAGIDSVFLTSAFKGHGVDEVEDFYFEKWVKPRTRLK